MLNVVVVVVVIVVLILVLVLVVLVLVLIVLMGIKILVNPLLQSVQPLSSSFSVGVGARQLVLCGDHCQLPPSVNSREAEMRGFSLSLYSRLVEAGLGSSLWKPFIRCTLVLVWGPFHKPFWCQ